MKKVIYLDYAATTPVDPRVAEKMSQCLTLEGIFANPASRSHRLGWQAEEIVDIARNQVADCIGADVREIIWTSGATESNNLAIKGAAELYRAKNDSAGHIITSAFEHKAVIDTCQYLETQGVKVTYLKPEPSGVISVDSVEQAITPETFLISIMQVNNEIGTIQPIQEIGELASEKNILFHVDAAQSLGKVAIDLSQLPVDLMSFSAHKIYGPKGIGCLYVKKSQQSNIRAQIHGGGHERGLRSGTLATHQIAGMGLAFELIQQNYESEAAEISQKKINFINGLKDVAGIHINADLKSCVASILNLRFEGVDAESLLMAFKDLAISSGSACTSASVEPSHVLKQLGLSDEQAHGSLRFSFGRFTTEKDIEVSIGIVKAGFEKLKAFNQSS
jgi:cysteine desulfurase